MSETNSAARQTPADRRTAPEMAVDRAALTKEKPTADTRTAPAPETADAAAPPRPPQTPHSADWCSRWLRLCAPSEKHHKAANAAPPAPASHVPNCSRPKLSPRNRAETNCECRAEEIRRGQPDHSQAKLPETGDLSPDTRSPETRPPGTTR